MLHGVTKSIKNMPLTITEKRERILMPGSFVVNHSGFNIKIEKICSE